MVNKEITINTQKLFIFNFPHFIKYLFGGQVLPMLLLFSLSFIFLPFSPLAFLFINLIIIMMVYKFAFDVLADTARGHMSPEVRQNYLVTNAIAVKVAIIALLIEGTLMWLKAKGYNDYRFVFIVFSTFMIPAIYMSLALTNSLLKALNPMTIIKIIKTTFLSYLLFVLFWMATISLHEIIISPFVFYHLPVFLDGIVSAFVEYAFLILNFHIMGYIIFQNRRVFDLEGLGFERVENDEITIQTVVVNPIYERIKRLLADDEAQLALSMAVELQKNGDTSLELQDLYKTAMQQKLYSPTNLDIANKVHNRLNNQQTSKAFNIVIEHLDAGKDYVEESPADIKQLIEHAVQINKTDYIATLVNGFHKKYPYHADVVPNYFLLAKVLYNDRDTRGKSKELLVGLVSRHPQDKCIPEIKAWLKGLELMSKK
ncbi:MAG: hypothetical protein JKY19_14315 [Alcanivoracaceae bacterium]|nr:hypothetical protein [Alcanivoracaceae bacterium]